MIENSRLMRRRIYRKKRENEALSVPAAGNCAIQAKLEIGQPNDKYEKEADAVADRVTKMPNHSLGGPVSPIFSNSGIQMKCAACEKEESVQRMAAEEEEKVQMQVEEEEEQVQMKAEEEEDKIQMQPEEEEEKVQMKPAVQRSGDGTMHASPAFAGKLRGRQGLGQALPNPVSRELSHKIGADFSHVHIHTDSHAIQMNQELGAQAFTHGSDIYFNKGKYDPGSSEGKHLLAHELTHVIQQGASIQRSCHDGNCDSCAGGVKDFWVTFYFRVSATRSVMSALRTMIREAKTILADCCLNLKADFNWDLLGGDRDVDPYTMNPDGTWSYNASVTDVGESTSFSSARGVPVLVVDNVQKTGGGITVGSSFDASYTGVEYFVLAVNQINSNPNCNHLAHELWHVGSNRGRHNAALDGSLAACTGNDVSANYCSGLRAMV